MSTTSRFSTTVYLNNLEYTSVHSPRNLGNLGMKPITLADVISQLQCGDAPATRRADMISAIRTLCRGIGVEPELVTANPRQLRERLKLLSPASLGVSDGRFANIRSLVLSALKAVGIRAMPGRYREPALREWEALRDLLTDRHFKSRTLPLHEFLLGGQHHTRGRDNRHVRGIRPGARGGQLRAGSRRALRDTCGQWNQAAAEVEGWPRLDVPIPNRRRDFSFALDAFPASFGEELGRYLDQRANPDVFADDYCKPVAPLTIRNRRRNLLKVATALVKSGISIEKITGLTVLVCPENAKTALKILLARAANKPTEQHYQIAVLLKNLARHYLRVGPKEVEQLAQLCRNLRPESRGLTEKNRACLRQFADPRNAAGVASTPRAARRGRGETGRAAPRRRRHGGTRPCCRHRIDGADPRRQSRGASARPAHRPPRQKRAPGDCAIRDEERQRDRRRAPRPRGGADGPLPRQVSAAPRRCGLAVPLSRRGRWPAADGRLQPAI